MAAIWQLLQRALADELAIWRGHARRRAGLIIALGGMAAITIGIAVALGVAAMSIRLGLVGALAVALGLAILVCLIVLILLHLEARAHARHVQAQTAEHRRLVGTALIAVLPGLKLGSAVAVGLAVLAVVLLTGKGRDDR